MTLEPPKPIDDLAATKATAVVHPTAAVHSSAILDANVAVGAETRIWHFCHVSEGAVIGERCVLGQNVFVGRDVHIGNGVKIQNNVSVVSGVSIEDDVFVGPSVVFTNVLRPRAFIEQKSDFVPTRIERGATLGANATILCGNSVGAYALVGAGSVITSDVPAYALVVGNPARQVGWVDKEGQPTAHLPAPTPTKA